VPESPNNSPLYANLQAANEQVAIAQSGTKGVVGGSASVDAAKDQVTTMMAAVQAENERRHNEDLRNALLLGYDSWWNTTINAVGATALDGRKEAMLAELEQGRYFVVLMAYDFQLMWKQKKTKLLWVTRYSITQGRHEFDKALAQMSREAARYFGQDTHGLVRTEVPEGRVEIGETQVVPDK
jgi:hypothetical protein